VIPTTATATAPAPASTHGRADPPQSSSPVSSAATVAGGAVVDVVEVVVEGELAASTQAAELRLREDRRVVDLEQGSVLDGGALDVGE